MNLTSLAANQNSITEPTSLNSTLKPLKPMFDFNKKSCPFHKLNSFEKGELHENFNGCRARSNWFVISKRLKQKEQLVICILFRVSECNASNVKKITVRKQQ
jgi:hypothetical protein